MDGARRAGPVPGRGLAALCHLQREHEGSRQQGPGELCTVLTRATGWRGCAQPNPRRAHGRRDREMASATGSSHPVAVACV